MSLFHFKNPLVRQLAWVMCSPNLLAPLIKSERQSDTPELVWDASCRQYFQRFQQQLMQLEQHPEPLQAFMQGSRSPRLGIQFERLLEYWLRWIAGDERNLQSNLVLQRPGDQTLGQLDFVWRENGQTWHWEAAVKFYLYHAGGETEHWLGPNANDSFEAKLQHLMQHQLPVAQSELARQCLAETPFSEPRSALFLKGYLFYPLADAAADPAHTMRLGANTLVRRADSERVLSLPLSAAHLKGWWQHYPYLGLPRVSEHSSWLPLPKSHWLGPQCFDARQLQQLKLAPLDETGLAAYCATHFERSQRALMLLEMLPKHECYYEISRGMLVAPAWPNLEKR